MQLSYINGMKIKLEVLDGDYITEYEHEYYLSEVVDVDSENKLRIALPIVKRAYMVFANDTKINIHYAHNDPRKACLYVVPCIVENLDKYSKPPCIVLNVVGGIIKRQRRNFFRVPCASDSNELLVMDCKQGKNITVCDISAKGVRIRSDEKIEMDCELTIVLKCLNNNEIVINGRVVRSRFVDSELIPSYDIGVEFYNLDKKIEETLTQYIMEKQRQLLSNTKR